VSKKHIAKKIGLVGATPTAQIYQDHEYIRINVLEA